MQKSLKEVFREWLAEPDLSDEEIKTRWRGILQVCIFESVVLKTGKCIEECVEESINKLCQWGNQYESFEGFKERNNYVWLP